MLGWLLIIVLVILLIGALPTWPYSSGWGYYPAGIIGLILAILLILLLFGLFPFGRVAPGLIWTPLIPSSFSEEKVSRSGGNTALDRPGQLDEVAPSYVFLASDDSSYMTGQVLHPNGGRIVNG